MKQKKTSHPDIETYRQLSWTKEEGSGSVLLRKQIRLPPDDGSSIHAQTPTRLPKKLLLAGRKPNKVDINTRRFSCSYYFWSYALKPLRLMSNENWDELTFYES